MVTFLKHCKGGKCEFHTFTHLPAIHISQSEIIIIGIAVISLASFVYMVLDQGYYIIHLRTHLYFSTVWYPIFCKACCTPDFFPHHLAIHDWVIYSSLYHQHVSHLLDDDLPSCVVVFPLSSKPIFRRLCWCVRPKFRKKRNAFGAQNYRCHMGSNIGECDHLFHYCHLSYDACCLCYHLVTSAWYMKTLDNNQHPDPGQWMQTEIYGFWQKVNKNQLQYYLVGLLYQLVVNLKLISITLFKYISHTVMVVMDWF